MKVFKFTVGTTNKILYQHERKAPDIQYASVKSTDNGIIFYRYLFIY